MSTDPESSTRLGVVLRTPQVPLLLAASLLGRLPLGSAPLAILLFASGAMPTSMAAFLVGAYTTGTAIGQPLLARIADRWRQPPVMWAAVTVSTMGFLVIAGRPDYPVLLAAALIAGLGAPPLEACLRVLWKELVPQRHLHSAYTLDITSQELIFIAGPLVTVAAAQLAGPSGGLAVIAAVQICGVFLFAGAPAVRGWRGGAAVRHWAGPLRSARVRLLSATTLLVGAAVGATTIAVARYAERAGVPAEAGWLLTAQATGALVGGLVVARYPGTGEPRRLPVVLTVLAAAYLPPMLAPPLPLMLLLLGVSGLALPAALSGIFTSTDRSAPAGTAAEAFAWVATAFAIGSAAGSAANGALIGTGGTAGRAVMTGFTMAPVAALAAAALLRARVRAVVTDAQGSAGGARVRTE